VSTRKNGTGIWLILCGKFSNHTEDLAQKDPDQTTQQRAIDRGLLLWLLDEFQLFALEVQWLILLFPDG